MEKRKLINKLKSTRRKLLKLSNTPKNALVVTSIFMDVENHVKNYKECDEKVKCLHELKLTYEKEMFNFFKQVKRNRKISNDVFNEYKSSVSYDIASCLSFFNVPTEEY